MSPDLQHASCLRCCRKSGLYTSHHPVPYTGACFVKDSKIHCRHYCPCALSHMKPNQYNAVLDWKLEAVSTRIYWFLSFSPVPSLFSAQALPFRPGSKALSFSKVWGVRFQTELCSCALRGQSLLWICVFTDLVSSLYSWYLAYSERRCEVCIYAKWCMSTSSVKYRLLVVWEERLGLKQIPLHCGGKIILIQCSCQLAL